MSHNDFFEPGILTVTASAPGRLDVMGGIADYSGSLLLQMPIAQTTRVTLQKRNDGIFQVRSYSSTTRFKEYKIDHAELKAKNAGEAGIIIRSKKEGDWAAYVMGCFVVLEEKGILQSNGANILIESNVPQGKGVSSSAALETATMHAIIKAYEISIDKLELPVLAQRVENIVAGAACGLMDQLSSQFGEKNKLLPLICQPHTVMNSIAIPKGILFSGIDSGVRHAVSGASYSDVRCAAFMAYSIIASNEGTSTNELKEANSSGDCSRLPYHGFLANIPVSAFEERYAPKIPEQLQGKEFLEKYGQTIDSATRVSIDKTYHLLACARHPVYENFRLNIFKQILEQFQKSKQKEENLQLLGELMFQSHAGYGAVGLGNEITDEIVHEVRNAGYSSGLYGARISGGGSGGTVVVLSYGNEGKKNARAIHQKISSKGKQKLFFFTGSNHGALTLNP